MKYNALMAKHIARHHVVINIKKSMMFFSYVEQPSKTILHRPNDGVSAYSREEPATLDFIPLLIWWQANCYKSGADPETLLTGGGSIYVSE